MRIFPRPIEISDTEGFTAEKDIFGRRELGAGLTNILNSVSDPMVIAIDGQWGSGKTTFLKMWAGELRKEGFPVIYFDAFENDYVEDAFAALAAEIIGLVEAEKKSAEPRAKEFKAKAVGALKLIGRSALKVGVKAASMGALDATNLGDEIVEAISSEAEDLTDKHIGEMLTKQAERKSTLQEFRNALRDLPSILGTTSGSSDNEEAPTGDEQAVISKPLVFIIDELDRCKPVFALQLLERIKHFFAVPNVHFVLGTHMGQLRNSVNAAYGANINSNTYLQKFISLTFSLTDQGGSRHDRAATKYIAVLKRDISLSSDDRDFSDGCISFIQSYALIHDSSLRDIEHLMTNVALAAAFTTKRTLRPPPLIAGLSILRVVRPDLYIKARLNKLSYEDVREALSLEVESADDDGRGYGDWARGWWEFCLKKEISEDMQNNFKRVLFSYSIQDRLAIVPLIAHKVVDNLIPPTG